MELFYATTNNGKVQSLQRDLTQYGITVKQAALDIPEPRSSDVEVIAKEKAHYAFKHFKHPIVVLDSGFYIDSLNGFPQAFVNFALGTIGIGGILKLVDGRDRSCDLRECLAYVDETLSEPTLFTAHIHGVIAPEPRGMMQPHLWSKLALIFVPDGRDQTLAEMTKEEYAALWKSLPPETSSGRMFGQWYVNNRMKD